LIEEEAKRTRKRKSLLFTFGEAELLALTA
jgi:hypothetical protein